jgi:hypothetical protein
MLWNLLDSLLFLILVLVYIPVNLVYNLGWALWCWVTETWEIVVWLKDANVDIFNGDERNGGIYED